MVFWFLFWILDQCSVVNPQIYMYYTQSPSLHWTNLKLHCLQYSDLQDWKLVQTIEYCLRPTDANQHWWSEGHPADDHQHFTFQQLSHANLTAEDILQWSTSADLAEDYQYYLNHNETRLASREVFRCQPPWFGPRCQYSFSVWGRQYFTIVDRLIRIKIKTKPLHNESYATCYIYFDCQQDGQPVCLHWNQVCDGRIDCIDGVQDELPCFALETNECQDGEYRCRNGLCIPQSLVGDKRAECLDQSDMLFTGDVDDTVSERAKIFLSKEYGCRPDQASFTCGDGQCVRDFETCLTGRHRMLYTWISAQGNLKEPCWMIMVCLTKIMDHVDGIACQSILQPAHINEAILHCDSLIQFPTKPILLHHVYFLYHRHHWPKNLTGEAATPAYICFDNRLCEHLRPTFYHQNLSCQTAEQMDLNSSISYPTWLSIIDIIRPHFHGCMLFKKNASSSLYCCQNSSECISRHRIVDGIIDCPHHDDERAFELSCSIKNQHRFRCENEQQCRSPLYPANVCPPRLFLELEDILFQDICNRIPQTKPHMIDGLVHTDETECQEWECNNVYTRCDNHWNCPNGEDELNCSSSLSEKCPMGSLGCLSLMNYTMICLPGKQVADGVMDCLGGADEQSVCRRNLQVRLFPGFLCQNTTRCLVPGDLCDGKRDCPSGDDEAFCHGRLHICNDDMNPIPTSTDQHVCNLAMGERTFFSFENLRNHPPSHIKTSRVSHIQQTLSSVQSELIPASPSTVNTPHPWYCHEGLAALVRFAPQQYATRCFCPPNFFGDRCQYQNQRVTITLKLHPVNRQGVRSFLVTLISDDPSDQDDIHSYHQFNYVVENTCGKTFKFFLLYSNRPKNISKNYFIKIDVFDQSTLTYLASWRYPIPFIFLPVNPMVMVLQVPAKPISSLSSRCRLKCEHGRCMQYLNNDEFYCQCEQGWTGKRCHQPVQCDDCARGSLCVGSFENRSICMCPINRFGRRCLLEYTCPEDFQCQNGGQCVIVDPSRSDQSYSCLCPLKYHGILCHVKKRVLRLSFDKIDVTRNLLVHSFETQSGDVLQGEKSSLNVFGQKLRMFQNSVTLYFGSFLQIVFIRFEMKYYLAVARESRDATNISTTITPKQECPHFNRIALSSLRSAPEIRRVKYYHHICRSHPDTMCFVDENYFCLCTNERHANCLRMNQDFRCTQDVHCLNGAQCLQEHPICPSMTFCVCTDCFFGDRCQFQAKGIGLTLDDLLRYELRPMTSLHGQNVVIKVSAAFTTIIFAVGVINSILGLMTFHRSEARQVGAGVYLLASSFTSLMTVTMFNVKVWFLILTHIYAPISRSILHAGCVGIEPILKSCIYTDSWLNACVTIERAISIWKGTKFNRQRSKVLAQWIILILPVVISISLMHEFLHRDLYDDEEEERIWCIMRYSSSTNNYSTFILSFHTVTPFVANLVSAISIVLQSARRKAQVQHVKGFWLHLQDQMKEHRHLLISPIILTLLSLPRLAISLISGCVKANRSPWLYLCGYFISLLPSVAIFFVFVLPSQLYKEQFYKSSQLFKQMFITKKRFSNQKRR